MTEYRRRLVSRLLSAAAESPVAAVLPEGWQLDALLLAGRADDRFRVEDGDGADGDRADGDASDSGGSEGHGKAGSAVVVVDVRGLTRGRVAERIAAAADEDLLLLTDDPNVRWPAGVRVLGPDELSVAAVDIPQSAPGSVRDVLEDGIRVSGGQPQMMALVESELRRPVHGATRAEELVALPGSDSRVAATVRLAWQLLGSAERQLLALIATLPGVTVADLLAAGLEAEASWQRCRLSGLVDVSADEPATTRLAREVLGQRLLLNTDDFPAPVCSDWWTISTNLAVTNC